MRITTDIDDKTLAEIMEMTGAKTKSSAVAHAASEYVRREKLRDFGRRIVAGDFDYPDTILDENGQDVTNPIPN